MRDDNPSYWKNVLKDVVRRNHRNVVWSGMARAAKAYLRAFNNENYYNFNFNGEAFVFETVIGEKGGQDLVVVDVGANRGWWAREALERLPTSEIHCFEIAPEMYRQMAANLKGFANVTLNSVGLSDQEGVLSLNYVPGADTISSVYDQPLSEKWGFERQKVDVKVTTGDKYVADRGIKFIDFLKIDTEGHDLKVLEGFRHSLSNKLIKLIQFEHGFVHIPARSLLFDFYNLLEPMGYVIGRLHPKSVDFKKYDHCEDEQFRMGNYIAVHSSYPALIAALQR